jgi:beta-lactam-binding protein with PASTA domain
VQLTYHVPAPPATVEIPDVRNMPWQQAKAALEKAGIQKIEWLKGRTAPRSELVNIVSDQRPAPGTRIAADEQVEIVVYLAPATASKP